MHLVHDRPFTHRVPDSMLSELCAEIFAQLPRSDQRRKGELYLRGLLSVGGRKSVRNIATHVGDRAAEQSLHHFISASTWDWNTVRAALGRHLERSVRPRAWVVHPVVIPKAGRHSVGVGPRFVPSLGQVVNSQHAVGVWAANEERSGPVNWRLSLGDDWRDAPLPGYPQVPEPELAATDLECAAGAAVELQGWVGGPPRPVVLDLPQVDPAALARRFAAAGMPFVAAVPGSTPVTPVGPALVGHDGRGTSAHQLLRMVRTLRRMVTWTDPVSLTTRTSLVAGIPVQLPGTRRPLVLLGEWTGKDSWPQRCWLSDLADTPWGPLLRLAKLSLRVGADFAAVSTEVGMVDFEGRSFGGWHRHTTLASAAHALTVEYRPRTLARPA
ncbi:IS701 family transposase [Streptomyces sp. BF23-19]|uniref:IS701 family transposase n=1 Tax=unclassified Streptomyces TaxID=2593676 RepID=UPI0034E44D0B